MMRYLRTGTASKLTVEWVRLTIHVESELEQPKDLWPPEQNPQDLSSKFISKLFCPYSPMGRSVKRETKRLLPTVGMHTLNSILL